MKKKSKPLRYMEKILNFMDSAPRWLGSFRYLAFTTNQTFFLECIRPCKLKHWEDIYITYLSMMQCLILKTALREINFLTYKYFKRDRFYWVSCVMWLDQHHYNLGNASLVATTMHSLMASLILIRWKKIEEQLNNFCYLPSQLLLQHH